MHNHRNTSELFSSNPGELLQRGSTRTDYQSDSAINSSQSFTSSANTSQAMASQMDNSQSSSFDLFSQMMSQQQGFSQQNESSSSKFYMKYMSKPPLFQKETTSKKPSLTRRKSFQEMHDFNREKAKERDDRDLINTFIAIVKECADEVKHAASSIRKDVDANIAETTEQTAAVISRITKELSQYHKQLLNNLKTREDHETRINELTEIIATKDTQIELLEAQLVTARKDRNEHLLKAMFDMYTEQQSVTRQHLEKVHEEQQNIKEQQHKLLEETEKSHATLSKVTAASHEKATSSHDGDPHGMMRDGVPPVTAGNTLSRSRHVSGPTWIRNAGPSNIMPVHAGSFNNVRHISEEHPARPMSVDALYYNHPCPVSYDHVGQSAEGTRLARPSSQASGMEPRNLGLRSSTSHLFQNHSVTHPAVSLDLLSPSSNYAMQKFLQQEGSLQQHEPVVDGRTADSGTKQYLQQQGRSRNPIQAVEDMPSASNLLRHQHRTSSYDNFANKFSSPNYTRSDKQLWSKKTLKPSPVAAVAPQMHEEPSDVETEETQSPAARPRKRCSRKLQGKTHFGSKKRRGKNRVASVQPQRKSARLSGRSGQEVERDVSRGMQEHTKEHSLKHQPNRAKKTSNSGQRCTSRPFPASNRGNRSREAVDDFTTGSEDSQVSSEWDVSTKVKMASSGKPPLQKQSVKTKQVGGYSAHCHTKISGKRVHPSNTDNYSDEEDEYSFHEDSEEEISHKAFAKRTQKKEKKGSGVKSIVSEVFTKRSISTYSNPKQNRLTPIQPPGSGYSQRLNSGSNDMRTQGGKDARKDKENPFALGQNTGGNKPVILDATQMYSDDEDSSQEIYFSLKLPDTNDVCAKQRGHSSLWSSLMSPSVNSRFPEQVVPDPDSDTPREASRQPSGTAKHHSVKACVGRNTKSNENKQSLKTNRKRRMIFSSQENMNATILQVSRPSQPRRPRMFPSSAC